jgi:cytochrome c2
MTVGGMSNRLENLRIATAAFGLLLFASCGGGDQEAATEEQEAAAPAEPTPAANATAALAPGERPAAYAQCVVCHSTEPGKHGLGPSLAGVSGRAAGSLPDFTYSEAMKASGLVWDRATLDEYLKAPAAKVPGTKMSYAGMTDDAKRTQVVDYVLSLK